MAYNNYAQNTLQRRHRKQWHRHCANTAIRQKISTTPQKKTHLKRSAPVTAPNNCNQKLETERQYQTAIHFCDSKLKSRPISCNIYIWSNIAFPSHRTQSFSWKTNFCSCHWPAAIDRYLCALTRNGNALCFLPRCQYDTMENLSHHIMCFLFDIVYYA